MPRLGNDEVAATRKLQSFEVRPLPFPDPRQKQHPSDVGLVAFYYPNRSTVWDEHCGSSFLGNFYPLASGKLKLAIGRQTHHFKNAESAFQATKFKDAAWQFELLDGEEAFKLKRSLNGQEDWSYGGFGSNWLAMWHVLKAKFARGSLLARKLVETGDAFLLEHNERAGRDKVWSDDCYGEGKNWLGLQLMLLRDELAEGAGQRWRSWLLKCVELTDGGPGRFHHDWEVAVKKAADQVREFFADRSRGRCLRQWWPGSSPNPTLLLSLQWQRQPERPVWQAVAAEEKPDSSTSIAARNEEVEDASAEPAATPTPRADCSIAPADGGNSDGLLFDYHALDKMDCEQPPEAAAPPAEETHKPESLSEHAGSAGSTKETCASLALAVPSGMAPDGKRSIGWRLLNLSRRLWGSGLSTRQLEPKKRRALLTVVVLVACIVGRRLYVAWRGPKRQALSLGRVAGFGSKLWLQAPNGAMAHARLPL